MKKIIFVMGIGIFIVISCVHLLIQSSMHEGKIEPEKPEPVNHQTHEGKIRRNSTESGIEPEMHRTDEGKNRGKSIKNGVVSYVNGNSIQVINEYMMKRFGNKAVIIEKDDDYKIRYIVTGVKNEILINSNRWERIQIDFFLTNKHTFLVTVDGFSAPGFGNKEPDISSYEDIEKDHLIELEIYAKKIRTEIEGYMKNYAHKQPEETKSKGDVVTNEKK